MFLEIKGIKKHYGEGESRVEVLNGIDIEVNKGEIVHIFIILALINFVSIGENLSSTGTKKVSVG